MPSDDYVSVGGGGALKLKGAKVNKKKKKKNTKPDLEKNLELGSESSSRKAITKRDGDENDDHEDNGDAPERYKTETERRYEEARKKKV